MSADPELRSPLSERKDQNESWRSVERGLFWVAVVLATLSVVSVGVQLWMTELSQSMSSGNVDAIRTSLVLNGAYQLGYFCLALLLGFSAFRVSRAPTRTGAVGPAAVAGFGFCLAALLNLSLLIASSEGFAKQALVGFLVARTAGMIGLGLALVRLGSYVELDWPRSRLLMPLGALVGDTVLSSYRLAFASSGFHLMSPWLYRGLSVCAQLILAGGLVWFAWEVRLALADEVEAEIGDEADALQANVGESCPPAFEELCGEENLSSRGEEPLRRDPGTESETDSSGDERLAPGGTLVGKRARRAGLAVTLGIATLPIWDAFERYRLKEGISNRLDGFEPGGGLPLWLFIVSGLFLGWLAYRLVMRRPYAARVVFSLAVLIGGGYVALSALRLARARSHAVDSWPVCGTSLNAHGQAVDVHSAISPKDVDGPTLDSNQRGCVLVKEYRDEHMAQHPQGDFRDGVVQIWSRFRRDRWRFFGGSLLSASCLLLAGVWIVGAARDEARPTLR